MNCCVVAGFAIVGLYPTAVQPCVPKEACQGGAQSACGYGYTGAQCNKCLPGFHVVAAYCVSCGNYSGMMRWLFLGMGVGAHTLNVLFLMVFFRKMSALGSNDDLIRGLQLLHFVVLFDLNWTGQAGVRYAPNGDTVRQLVPCWGRHVAFVGRYVPCWLCACVK